MCVCAFNQHGLTMLMLAQYSMQEREPWKPTSRGSIVTPRRLMKGKPHVCNRHCRWKYLTRGHVSNRTGTRTKWGLMMDGWNSAIRYYKNNFSDGFRQVRLLQRKSYWSTLLLFVCLLIIYKIMCIRLWHSMYTRYLHWGSVPTVWRNLIVSVSRKLRTVRK